MHSCLTWWSGDWNHYVPREGFVLTACSPRRPTDPEYLDARQNQKGQNQEGQNQTPTRRARYPPTRLARGA
jgi:hypothetical protein